MAEGSGLKFTGNLFPKNTMEHDPNMRGAVPMVEQVLPLDVTLVAGVISVDNVASEFGTGKGTVLGGYLLNTADTTNHVLSIKVEAGTNPGTIKYTIESTDATSTTNVVGYAFAVGEIYPTNA